MILDGADVRYLLQKKGFSFTDVARQIGVTPGGVFLVSTGQRKSKRITSYIENLLGIKPGTLEITPLKRDELVKVA